MLGVISVDAVLGTEGKFALLTSARIEEEI
jgi:hypothetical protein